MVSTTCTIFNATGVELVLVEFLELPNAYVVKFILVESGYVVPTSTNFTWYNFFQIPKFVLSWNLLYFFNLIVELMQ